MGKQRAIQPPHAMLTLPGNQVFKMSRVGTGRTQAPGHHKLAGTFFVKQNILLWKKKQTIDAHQSTPKER